MFKQFYCSKNVCDAIEYTLKGAYIESARLTLAQARRQLHATSIYKFKKVTWLPSPLTVCAFVCGGVETPLCASFTYFGQLLRCAHKRIVNNIIMKVYIERNNMQVELIRFRKKYLLYSGLCLWSENSMRPMCLRLESRYNISLFDSNLFNCRHFSVQKACTESRSHMCLFDKC